MNTMDDNTNNNFDPTAIAQSDAQYEAETQAAEAEAEADIVRRAKECHALGMEVSAEWREAALTDLKFLAGEQWDPNVKGMRDAAGRPALTVNRLPQFVRQITNEQRQSKPSVTVNPVDSGSDVRTAEVLQGIIRNIEYTSNADSAYATAGQAAATTGLGYWDVRAEYEDERSFEQRLVISRIKNALSVVMDPGTKEVAGDDARWAVISSDIPKAEWQATFPGREIPNGTGWDGRGDAVPNWVAKDGVRIHEYRWIEEVEDTLVEVPPGIFDDMPEGGAALESELDAEVFGRLVQLTRTRKTTRRKARFAKIAGDEVIEQGELAGRYLQLVRVVGTELDIDGETIFEGVIRHARDSQRMLNYFVSAEAEAIALAPKAPFIAAEGQIENHEEVWETANTATHSYLPYKPMAIGGVMVPPPQRVMAEANVQAITNARLQANDDLKGTTGIYDASLGARSNESSGKAILARESQGQTANFHFNDNLGMAIRYTGRILIDLIPKIYSGPRTLRILGEDGKHEMVPVNGAEGQFRGEDVSIDLNAGRYDVAVSMGPGYASRRQEAVTSMLELIRANPAVSQVAGDLLVDAMDWPGAKAIAERLRKMLPPEIRPPDEKKTPPPQVLAMQLQQQGQLVEQLTERLNQLQAERETQALDNEAKERIEMAKLHTSILLKLAELDSKESVELLKAEAAAVSKRLALTGFQQPVAHSEQQQPAMPPQMMQPGEF